MKVENMKKVSVAYTLTVDGSVADKATAEKPLEFIFGIGQLLPKFEAAILGKEAGDKVEFTLEPKDGYGEVLPLQTIEFPKSDFYSQGADPKEVEKILKPGAQIPLYTKTGQMVSGTIKEIGESVVKIEVDINHPMAGKTLNFAVEVVGVRDLTPQEEEQLRNPHHCGCGCGSEGGDCGCGDGSCTCDEEHGCGCEGHCCEEK